MSSAAAKPPIDPGALPTRTKFLIFGVMAFGQFMALIDIQIVGKDLAGNRKVADQLLRKLAGVPGLADLHLQQPIELIDGEMTSWYGVRAIAGLKYLADLRRRHEQLSPPSPAVQGLIA